MLLAFHAVTGASEMPDSGGSMVQSFNDSGALLKCCPAHHSLQFGPQLFVLSSMAIYQFVKIKTE